MPLSPMRKTAPPRPAAAAVSASPTARSSRSRPTTIDERFRTDRHYREFGSVIQVGRTICRSHVDDGAAEGVGRLGGVERAGEAEGEGAGGHGHAGEGGGTDTERDGGEHSQQGRGV